jgi:phage-related protein (TIGR01555 family)
LSELNLQNRIDALEKEVARMDGIANVLVGLGGKMDKRIKSEYRIPTILDDVTLHSIYLGDGIGTRIIDIPANDMTREWIDLAPKGSDDKAAEEHAEELEEELEKIGTETAFNTALKWKRLYGGSIIVIGALDGRTWDQPLNITNIKKIESLKVIDRTDVFLFESVFQTDTTKPGFGEPIQFKIRFHTGTTDIDQMVHASRCIIFKGKPIPYHAIATKENRWWGVSELQSIFDSLRDFAGIFDSVSNVMYEFLVGKFKIDGLADMLTTKDGESRVMTRVEIIAAMKSIIHAVLLDTNEEYDRDSASLAGISDVLDRYIMRLSGTSGIPVTRLFGRQAGGLNNKGEAEEGIYYDEIRSKQKTELKPQLHQLLELIQIIKKDKSSLLINFNPLFQTTQKEQADIKKIEAEAEAQKASMYNSYITAGVLMPEDAYAQEWEEKLGPREFPDPEELEQEEEIKTEEAPPGKQEKTEKGKK